MPNADGAGYYRFALDAAGWRALDGELRPAERAGSAGSSRQPVGGLPGEPAQHRRVPRRDRDAGAVPLSAGGAGAVAGPDQAAGLRGAGQRPGGPQRPDAGAVPAAAGGLRSGPAEGPARRHAGNRGGGGQRSLPHQPDPPARPRGGRPEAARRARRGGGPVHPARGQVRRTGLHAGRDRRRTGTARDRAASRRAAPGRALRRDDSSPGCSRRTTSCSARKPHSRSAPPTIRRLASGCASCCWTRSCARGSPRPSPSPSPPGRASAARPSTGSRRITSRSSRAPRTSGTGGCRALAPASAHCPSATRWRRSSSHCCRRLDGADRTLAETLEGIELCGALAEVKRGDWRLADSS